jgi:hypothetical protein
VWCLGECFWASASVLQCTISKCEAEDGFMCRLPPEAQYLRLRFLFRLAVPFYCGPATGQLSYCVILAGWQAMRVPCMVSCWRGPHIVSCVSQGAAYLFLQPSEKPADACECWLARFFGMWAAESAQCWQAHNNPGVIDCAVCFVLPRALVHVSFSCISAALWVCLVMI